MAVPTPPNGRITEWFRLGMLALNVLMVPLFLWGVQLDRRVAVMENNRYTSNDALVDARAADEALRDHAVLEGHPVLVERVHAVEARVNAD